ncbi:hypothetical protein [Dyella sp. S184]|uniref:hypothetical protein n=1 Tax=Dyella sp. S184 TaxID=1641862 RepID=UPI00131CE4DF|nr:hypothetical protein [Dyella sp. S184]
MSWKPIPLTDIDNHYLAVGSYCDKAQTTDGRMRKKDRRLRAALALADPWHMDLTVSRRSGRLFAVVEPLDRRKFNELRWMKHPWMSTRKSRKELPKVRLAVGESS